jgi:phytoene synthase
MFDPFPWDVRTAEGIWFRGNLLFGLAARVLGSPDESIQAAGGLWALVDAARHCSDAPSRAMLLEQARTFARGLGGVRYKSALRPLSMLASLAIRDAFRGEPFEPEGTPARAAAMLRHRMTGRLPKA